MPQFNIIAESPEYTVVLEYERAVRTYAGGGDMRKNRRYFGL